ncbi:MAG: hypothetical protein CVU89_03380 [Firmicutes bacterium HGW-Firmicutes-14]|nr:MAG: hypothetical protein CVU89_03380 [Firmicutes bacterium HGW-Firmicutes-14]
MKNANWEDLPLLLTPTTIWSLFKGVIGRDNVYAWFKRPDFPAVKAGKRLIVSRDAFKKWLEQNNVA